MSIGKLVIMMTCQLDLRGVRGGVVDCNLRFLIHFESNYLSHEKRRKLFMPRPFTAVCAKITTSWKTPIL